MTRDAEHIFSSFGAGTLRGCPTYWSKHCTFEPIGFWKEYSLLLDKGVSPQITIHPDCPVTTVYDVWANRNSIELEHGTTGTGFFRTKKRHFIDSVHFSVHDLIYGTDMYIVRKLDEIQNYFGVTNEIDTDIFHKTRANMLQLVRDKALIASDQLDDYEHLVFEGSQGLLLDEKIGQMPHCTPSDLTPHNILDMGYQIDEIYLVSRVYQTRHGNGPMTNENYTLWLTNTENETNIDNKFQGKFRTSVLDLDQLIYAKTKGIDAIVPGATKISLVLTCADQMPIYQATLGKRLFAFEHVEEFASFVRGKLGVNGDVYINDSPYGNLTLSQRR